MVFQNLKSEIIPTDTSSQVLKKRINFEGVDTSSLTSSEKQKKKEIIIRRPLNFYKNNV